MKADDGLIYTINVAPCTQLNANKANYKMAAGHKAIVKGWRAANAKANRVAVDGSQVTCLNWLNEFSFMIKSFRYDINLSISIKKWCLTY